MADSQLKRGSGSAQRNAGFTLTELMIVVTIVAILAAVAYPLYVKTVLRSNRSEARATLFQITQNLERYFTERNTYVGATLGAGGGVTTNVWPTTTSPKALYNLDFSVTPTATTYTIRATATGPQARDSACPSLTLDATGMKAPAACW